jgi:uncharacterized RDD family membrane protein YckC
VKLTRFFAIVIYVGYLVNVGLFFLLIPWSRAWGMLLARFPPTAHVVLDSPWFRGMLSAFGLLHLLMVVWELLNPTLLTPEGESRPVSQDSDHS